MSNSKWTKETILDIAKQYPNVKAWKLGNMPSYQAAQRYKILKEARNLLSNELHRTWSIEDIKIDALNYDTKVDWLKNSAVAYGKAYQLGILEECSKHMQVNRVTWTRESVLEIAKKYKRRAEWREACPNSLGWAREHGILEECCAHMKKTWAHSRPELELLEWVKQYYPEAGPLKTKTLALDIYIAELNLGIEYNGCYYHSEKSGKTRTYHLDKTNFFKNMGIDVVHIWSYEWRDSEEQVKNFLLSKLRKCKTIGARLCDFKEIDKSIARKFCNDNHIQGSTSVIK